MGALEPDDVIAHGLESFAGLLVAGSVFYNGFKGRVFRRVLAYGMHSTAMPTIECARMILTPASNL